MIYIGMVYIFLEQYKRSHLSQVLCIIFNEFSLGLQTSYSDPRAKPDFFIFILHHVKVGNSSGNLSRILSRILQNKIHKKRFCKNF